MSRARDNANLSPTIPDARMPNLTGDVTTSEGAVATTIADDAVDSQHYAAGSIDAEHLHANAVFASGTKMIFNQTAAPTGWTKVTGSGNDTALRVTTGTVGTGGTQPFETAFASHTPTASSGAVQNHTLTYGQLPDHLHNIRYLGGGSNDWGLAWGASSSSITSTHGTGDMGNGPHNHSFTQPTISAVNLDVSYVDVIIATKD